MLPKLKTGLQSVYRKIESPEHRIPEMITLCVYILMISVIMCFHEPWYDEAQAWLISRDASWYEILFEIPHYEGHPPFWYVLLAAFSKNGADFDLTLKIITLFFNALAICLLLFRSPFPRIIRCTLPFTYFLFYQHGVIARPYFFLLIGFLLAADFWNCKNEKPFRMVFALMLMCASSAYGIIFAGGISIVWLAELWKKQSVSAYFRTLLRGRRFFALLSLLLFALVNIALIFPRSDTFAASYGLTGNNSIVVRLLYMFFGSIADATCFNAYEDYEELRYAVFSLPKLLIGCLIGALLIAIIRWFAKRCDSTKLFFVPFSLFALFSGIVYFYLQHVDVLFQFLIFWAWVSCKNLPNVPAVEKEEPSTPIIKHFKTVAMVSCVVCMCVSMYWNVGVCINEIRFQYGFSQQMSAFLNQYGLDKYGVMVRWMQLTDENGVVTYTNTNQTVNGVALNAYYDTNIVINMNGGDPQKTFATHRIPDEKEVESVLQKWKDDGFPAITLDRCQLKTLFPSYRDIYTQFYTSVLTMPEYHLWKTGYKYTSHKLYVRNDIARKHLLIPVE